MDDKLITWRDVYKDFEEHFPDIGAIDYRPFHPFTIYVWLEDGRVISYNYHTKRKKDEKRGTWERMIDGN